MKVRRLFAWVALGMILVLFEIVKKDSGGEMKRGK
jgi:hypothetical protein